MIPLPIQLLFLHNFLRGCNAVGCANTNEHRPTNTRNSFSAPEAALINPSLARKRTGDAEIGWRPMPEKNIETMPCWGKNSP
jgi:hypothetical protein